MTQPNLINRTKTRRLAETTIEVSTKIYEDIVSKLEAVADSDNLFYIKALESIDDDPNIFKDFIYFALKDNFNCREIELLAKSETSSRNFSIAYKKLSKFYKKSLTDKDRESLHMTYCAMVSYIFEFVSADFVELENPEKVEDEKNNAVNPKKLYTDYNEINELFVK